MTKTGVLTAVSVVLVFSLITLGFYFKGLDEKEVDIKNDLTPNKGEIWENYPDGGNPFSIIKTREVLDVKRDYVKYVEGKDTIVIEDYIFKIWSVRVK